MENTLLKEIETAGKNTEREYKRVNPLEEMHKLGRIDYNKPIFIAKIAGRFTERQIEKELNAAGLNSFKDIVFLIVKPATRWTYQNDLHLAVFEAGKIVYNLREHFNGNYTAIDTFYRRADVEEARKNCEYVYIIAQATEHTTPAKPEAKPDEVTRYTFNCNTVHATVYKTPNGISVKYYAPHRYGEKKTASDIIDKSGYMVDIKRERLKDKARKLREEREKAAYMATDNAETIKELEALTQEAKKVIIAQIEAAANYEEMNEAGKSADRLKWVLFYFGKLKEREANREYRSVEDFNEAAESIHTDLEKITKKGEIEA